MPEHLLDRVLSELRERLDESRAAYEESRRLEAALAALDTGRDGPGRSRTVSRRTRPAKAATAKRAPRGHNLRRIREAIEQRPGATAGEVASATGIARPTAASTLGKLAREGELEKTELPGGGVGYRRAKEREAVAEAVAGATEPGIARIGNGVWLSFPTAFTPGMRVTAVWRDPDGRELRRRTTPPLERRDLEPHPDAGWTPFAFAPGPT